MSETSYYMIGLDEQKNLAVKRDPKYCELKISHENLSVLFDNFFKVIEHQIDQSNRIDNRTVKVEICSDNVKREFEGSEFLTELEKLYDIILTENPELMV